MEGPERLSVEELVNANEDRPELADEAWGEELAGDVRLELEHGHNREDGQNAQNAEDEAGLEIGEEADGSLG